MTTLITIKYNAKNDYYMVTGGGISKGGIVNTEGIKKAVAAIIARVGDDVKVIDKSGVVGDKLS